MGEMVLSAIPILKFIPLLYIFFSIYCICRVINKYKSIQGKIVGGAVVFSIFYGFFIWDEIDTSINRNLYKKRSTKAEAIFDKECMKAEEKIYRTADNVEGVLLLNVPPEPRTSDYHDSDWLYAGLPGSGYNDNYIRLYNGNYIRLFLDRDGKNIPPRPGGIDLDKFSDMESVSYFGFSYVDFKDDDVIVRYRYKNSWGEHLWRDFRPVEPARYAISVKNYPAPRESGVAGAKVIITDTLTNKVMAEKIWYSFAGVNRVGIFETKKVHSWHRGMPLCPQERRISMICTNYSCDNQIRIFVDKVLRHKGVS